MVSNVRALHCVVTVSNDAEAETSANRISEFTAYAFASDPARGILYCNIRELSYLTTCMIAVK